MEEPPLEAPRFPPPETGEEFGDDFVLDEELETILLAAEAKAKGVTKGQAQTEPEPMDIEEAAPPLSPFERFRRHGYLSVSDLVGTVWCEVQYDYRLRTLPFLPPASRPSVITSDKGKEIVVNKVKEEGRERIVKRGQTIHKRLEREIHPEEIVVTTESREDVWGLRFLNMLAALEALITLGTCREMPVVGFVGGILVTGIIDELQRRPVNNSEKATTRSSRQTSLTSFFPPTKPFKTHKVYLSDSKTRARDSLPKEADTMAGQLQCMMYKELLDAMLLSNNSNLRTLSFDSVFDHLSLRSAEPFSDVFISQTRAIIKGNGLRQGAGDARNLQDMVRVWQRYVAELGLGDGSDNAKASGRTETRLELVYRRAGPKKVEKSRRREEKREDLKLAIAESLKLTPDLTVISTQHAHTSSSDGLPKVSSNQVEMSRPVDVTNSQHSDYHVDRTSDEEREEDELALAVEMSLDAAQKDDKPGDTAVSLSQQGSSRPSEDRSSSPTPPPGTGTASGSIIGRHRFQHDPKVLEDHLTSVLQYWRGEREPVGVEVMNTGRCAWCEFEEGCEWRSKKAEEDWSRIKAKRT